jgi:hypothetical protein
VPSELAATTAAAVLSAGRDREASGVETQSLVGLADTVGLDTLRALWRGAPPVSLASSLWALYLLRSWCVTGAAEVVRLWALGEPQAAADAVVAGVNALADEAAMGELADAILTGAFTGDFAVALERAASVFRVLAAGRRQLPDAGDGLDAGEAALAEGNERAADGLAAAAQQWRANSLR